MTDDILNSGKRPRRSKSESKSTPAPAPQETSSQPSQLPHRRDSEPQAPQAPSEKREAVAALLRGEEIETPTPAPAPERSEAPAEPASGDLLSDPPEAEPRLPEDVMDPKALAEKLGMTAKQLYDNVQLTTQDGETLSLGELKDRVMTQETATRAQIERETTLDRRESGMTETMQLLSTIGDDVAAKFPKAAEALAGYNQQMQTRERRAAMSAMPELQDRAYREQFRGEIAEYLEPYGFRAAQINVVDHRILLALRDAMKTKKQLDKLMAFSPDAPPPRTQRPQTGTKRRKASETDQLVANARSTGSKADQIAAAAALLRKG